MFLLQCLSNLKNLYLSHSKNLIEVPDLSEVPHLMDLDLGGCMQLLGIGLPSYVEKRPKT